MSYHFHKLTYLNSLHPLSTPAPLFLAQMATFRLYNNGNTLLPLLAQYLTTADKVVLESGDARMFGRVVEEGG